MKMIMFPWLSPEERDKKRASSYEAELHHNQSLVSLIQLQRNGKIDDKLVQKAMIKNKTCHVFIITLYDNTSPPYIYINYSISPSNLHLIRAIPLSTSCIRERCDGAHLIRENSSLCDHCTVVNTVSTGERERYI